MNRSLVRLGNRARAFAMLAALAWGCAPAVAFARGASEAPTVYWYAGTRLSFDRPQTRGGTLAVALDDFGLGRFLRKLNATVSYQPGQKYVAITTGDRRSITFALDDAEVTVDGVAQAAAFGPYVARSTVYLPFIDLARALGVVPVADDGMTVLQPQIAALDVKTDKGVTLVTVRGASTLQYKRLSEPNEERLSLAFLGIGSPLDRDRTLTSPALRAVSLTVGGTPKNPTTVLNFDAAPGATHVLVPSGSPNAVVIAFAPAGVALDGTAIPAQGDASTNVVPIVVRDSHAPPPSPPPAAFRGAQSSAPPRDVAAAANEPAPAAVANAGNGTASGGAAFPTDPPTTTPTADTLAPATITALTTDATDGGFNVHLAIAGPVTYEWHRLADFRWYVDLKPATLGIAPQDTVIASSAVESLRVKPFVGPIDKLQSVRVGLTLPSPRTVTLVPGPTGLTISVGATDDASPAVAGVGELANGQLVTNIVPLPPPPLALAQPQGTWKFGGGPVDGSRLIVIDPGHGGSDFGAIHNGMNEKDLTLDMSRRLRSALIARGWQVRMTRDSDVDVYAPNDGAREELQARDDVANNAGARLLISVHVNAFTTSDLSGTTTYYYKDDSRDLAEAVHGRLADMLPTKDDGVRKENFYVIHHTDMPSILVETAFVSNPGDAALLRSDAFKNKVAQAIAAGVGDYAKPGSSSAIDGQ